MKREGSRNETKRKRSKRVELSCCCSSFYFLGAAGSSFFSGSGGGILKSCEVGERGEGKGKGRVGQMREREREEGTKREREGGRKRQTSGVMSTPGPFCSQGEVAPSKFLGRWEGREGGKREGKGEGGCQGRTSKSTRFVFLRLALRTTMRSFSLVSLDERNERGIASGMT